MKQKKWIAVLLLACCLHSTAQKSDTVSFMQGVLPLSFIYHNNSDSEVKICAVNVHENENTSVTAVQSAAAFSQYKLLYLRQYGKRNIAYSFNGTDTFYFDPNRIFTLHGIKTSLETNSRYHDSAVQYAQKIADTILQWLQNARFIIALHNNSDRNYSIMSYKRKGIYAADAARYYINPLMDADDFIFTTDEKLYKWMKRKNINAVLQNNTGVTDDGSLSVFYKDRQVPYVNIEAEHGHLKQQIELIDAVFLYIREIYLAEH